MCKMRVLGLCGFALLMAGMIDSPLFAGHPAAWAGQPVSYGYGARVGRLAQDEAAARRQLIDYTNDQRRQLQAWFQHALNCSPHDRAAVAREYARRLQAINRGFVEANINLSRYYGHVRDHARERCLDGPDRARSGERFGYSYGSPHGWAVRGF